MKRINIRKFFVGKLAEIPTNLKKIMGRYRQFLKKYKQWLFVFAFGGFLFEIFLFKTTTDLVILLLAGFWILSIWVHKFKGKVSVVAGLFFYALSLIMLIFKLNAFSDKSASWAYVFLVVGIIQLFLENFKEMG